MYMNALFLVIYLLSSLFEMTETVAGLLLHVLSFVCVLNLDSRAQQLLVNVNSRV